MHSATSTTRRTPHWPQWCLFIALTASPLCVAQAPADHTSAAPAAQASHAPNGSDRVPLDRVVAVVNNDLILESDVDAEERFAAFELLRSESAASRKQIINRLIDRDLIGQQMAVQPQAPIPDSAVDAQIAELRKSIPQCAQYHCETDSGWQKFCGDHGFTPQEVRERWRTRMQILAFIEQRFRFGIQITQQEIDTYYKTKLIPAYQKRNLPPPAESDIHDRIQEVLLQEQVTALLDDWIKALRAEGSVRILEDGNTPNASSPNQNNPDQNNPDQNNP